MAKTNRGRRRMDRYFNNLGQNSYILSYNKKGSCKTKIRKWDVIRRLTKKLAAEEDQSFDSKESKPNSDPGVQLLPRQDVILYGTIPSMEQRVYSKCKNCCRVFNPRDILSHKNCLKSQVPHSNLLKKNVKNKSRNSRKPNSNGNANSNHNTVSNQTILEDPLKDALKDFEFKRPFTPPPINKSIPISVAPTGSMPELKVSVTKIGLSKPAKSPPVTTTASILSTTTTSSDKLDTKTSSKATSVHHSSKSSSGHHTSKTTGHIPRSSSSSSSSHPKSPSNHHSSKSSQSHHSSKSPSSNHHSPRATSKSHHSSSHHGSSSNHHSSKTSASKATPMDTLPPSSSSHHHHHHSSSSSSHSSSKHRKSNSSSSKRSNSGSSSNSSNSSSSKDAPKNFDPSIHCGVVEGNRGPCMRSLTCSNHRLHLRKQVPGRSKDIQKLIAERKATKENVSKHAASCSYTPPNGEIKESSNPTISFAPAVDHVASTITDPTATSSSSQSSSRSTNQCRLLTFPADKQPTLEVKTEPAAAVTNGYIVRAKNVDQNPDNAIGTVPVVILPASPVSVVSSIQLIRIGNNIISLETPHSANTSSRKPTVIKLPQNMNSVLLHKTHPKPLTASKYGARKVGGSILLTNPRLAEQRNELFTPVPSGGSILLNAKIEEQKTDVPSPVAEVSRFVLDTEMSEPTEAPKYAAENGPSRHEMIIRLIDGYGF